MSISRWLSIGCVSLPFLLLLPASMARGGDLRSVPLRWCACLGSPAVANPAGAGEVNTVDVLWRRHERASDRTWIPGAGITFRSAMTQAVANSSGFPLIPDGGGPGVQGDVLDPNIDASEMNALVAKCVAKWDSLAAANGTTLPGPVALNINRFVNSSGQPVTLRGRGWMSFNTNGGDYCRMPSVLTSTHDQAVVVADNQTFPDPDELLLAHELGHMLGCDHGNGLDDNMNGVFEWSGCDPGEISGTATPLSVMSDPDRAKVVTSLQRTYTREVARATPGSNLDPPGVIITDVVGDQRSDPVGDVADPSVDMMYVDLSNNTALGATAFSFRLLGAIPEEARRQYAVFLDLDGNAATGGSPSTLGFPTAFEGAEIVGLVSISPIIIKFDPAQGRSVLPTVWRFNGTTFVTVSDPNILAFARSPFGEPPAPTHEDVTLQVPNSILGSLASRVRMQAISHQLDGAGETDRLPGTSPDAGLDYRPVAPQYPICNLVPPQVRKGQIATVEVSGLYRDFPLEVILGDALVARGQTDAAGSAQIPFRVPFNATEGPRLVTVGNDGTAVTADCLLEVLPGPALVALDVKPGSCPNPIQKHSQGVLPVAIPGGGGLDVTQIDVSSVRLEGVAPLSSPAPVLNDVASPFAFTQGTGNCLLCSTTRADGATDLVLHFDLQQIWAALQPGLDGECRQVTLTASLRDGTPIVAQDVVRLQDRGLKPHGEVAIAEVGTVAPNPLRSGQMAALSLRVPSGEPRPTAGLIAVSGRKLAALEAAAGDDGSWTITWNGRADDGSSVAPGLYFVRVHTQAQDFVRPIVVLP